MAKTVDGHTYCVGYDGATRTFLFDFAWPVAPDAMEKEVPVKILATSVEMHAETLERLAVLEDKLERAIGVLRILPPDVQKVLNGTYAMSFDDDESLDRKQQTVRWSWARDIVLADMPVVKHKPQPCSTCRIGPFANGRCTVCGLPAPG